MSAQSALKLVEKSPSLRRFLRSNTVTKMRKGPVAIVFCPEGEDATETINHLKKIDFKNVIVIGNDDVTLSESDDTRIFQIRHDIQRKADIAECLNGLIDALAGRWIYWTQSGEYLFFPFCETRSIGDVVQFLHEERRRSCAAVTVDLYPENPAAFLKGDDTPLMFDSVGYFNLGRFDEAGSFLERQPIIQGGLRWRRAHQFGAADQQLERVPLFKAALGLRVDAELRFNCAEMNTISCPWHNNLTMAIASMRACRALCENAPTASDVGDFCWAGSQRFEWNSHQLLQTGFMEPGQWF